jgi:hypothetical protein
MYAKIEDGKLSLNCPRTLRKVIANPSADDYAEFGWLPIQYPPDPDVPEGYHLEDRGNYTEADIVNGVIVGEKILVENIPEEITE